jgi:hypothetical protein
VDAAEEAKDPEDRLQEGGGTLGVCVCVAAASGPAWICKSEGWGGCVPETDFGLLRFVRHVCLPGQGSGCSQRDIVVVVATAAMT